jgi:predicted DNA-binding transcriptional regulator AlpA
MAEINPQDFLTPKELAARLKVKQGWIYEKMRPRQGNPLPVIKMGRFLRFHWPAVSEWLIAQQRHTPKPKKAA